MRMLWFLAFALIGNAAAATDVLRMKKIDTIGAWELRRDTDPFSDRTVCVLLNSGNPAYQATLHALYIRNQAHSGKLSTYKLRFDDDAPSPVRTVSASEKTLNALKLEFFDIGRLVTASRLRLEILSLPQHGGNPIVANVDLNVAGFDQARERWRQNGCPN